MISKMTAYVLEYYFDTDMFYFSYIKSIVKLYNDKLISIYCYSLVQCLINKQAARRYILLLSSFLASSRVNEGPHNADLQFHRPGWSP